jgi:hypothetical protein
MGRRRWRSRIIVRAGTLGLHLMVAIIGGEPKWFRPLIDLYREAGRRAGHSAEKLVVGLHAIGFLGDTTQEAADDFYPGYAHTFTEIGKERGWPPATRAQFDALRGPTDALRGRSSRRPFSNYLSNGCLCAPVRKDSTVDQTPGNQCCSDRPETAHNCVVALG